MVLRMGVVCTIAAMVAAAVVFLFSPKQTAHKLAQADVLAPASADDDSPPASIESSRAVPTEAPAGVRAGVPAGVPAMVVETSAGATAQPPPQIPQAQLAAAAPPQLTQGKVVTAPPAKPETAAEPTVPAQQIASLPTPNASPANIRPSPAPDANEPAPRPVDANPAATEPKPAANPAPSPAPAQAAPPSAPNPAVGLDENEIGTLFRRGKNLLNDGDFAGARVLFERAANAGSAEAALALGSTYDPNVIKRLGAIMVKPDIERARKWYQFAADRGLAAASLQLANLPQSR
jgi:TPR repeat protein